ncbi:MAG: hypothetical protein MUE85_20455 [Microscillaceae bacterium]|jgi:hypothetical protein|nr:hypothetical protein [Microscillaceae bacterium]
MKNLEKDWLTTGLIDFEYKQYMLLAYLKSVKENFDRVRLYPYLSDLVFHYQNLLDIKNNKQLIYANFPQTISQADFEKLNFEYKKIVEDDAILKEIEDILLFALPQLKGMLEEGKDIYEYIEKNLEIQPIGITPLNTEAGYLFLIEHNKNEMQVFEYQLTIFENASEKYRGMHTLFLESIVKTLSRTLESIKLELIKKYQKLAHPATYLIYSRVNCPMNETLLPVAKRAFVKHICNNSSDGF